MGKRATPKKEEGATGWPVGKKIKAPGGTWGRSNGWTTSSQFGPIDNRTGGKTKLEGGKKENPKTRSQTNKKKKNHFGRQRTSTNNRRTKWGKGTKRWDNKGSRPRANEKRQESETVVTEIKRQNRWGSTSTKTGQNGLYVKAGGKTTKIRRGLSNLGRRATNQSDPE